MVLDLQREWIPDKNRETFNENIKVAAFKKNVEDYQKGLSVLKEAATKTAKTAASQE